MKRYAGVGLGLLIGGIVGGLLPGRAVTQTPQEGPAAEKVKVVFPPNHAVLLSGSFDVITKAGEGTLKVDGTPRQWGPFKPPIRVAPVGLDPGLHELKIGNRRLEVVVALNAEEHDGPADWEVFERHSIGDGQDRCADCHKTERQDGQIAVGELMPYTACFGCHDSVEFDVTHSHPLEPLEHCQMCHALHGSSRKGLLKAPVKQLCDECHES